MTTNRTNTKTITTQMAQITEKNRILYGKTSNFLAKN
jgi:hypothetical protein